MPKDYIRLEMEDQELHVNTTTLVQLLARVQAIIFHPDESNTMAGFISAMRLTMKAVVRPFMPRILAAVLVPMGKPVPEIPRAKDCDQLDWLLTTLLTAGIEYAAQKEWRVLVDGHDYIPGQRRILTIRGFVAIPTNGGSDHPDQPGESAAPGLTTGEYLSGVAH